MEMMVVVALVATISGIVVPNLAGWAKAQEARSATEAVYRLAIRARDIAETEGTATELVYDSSQRSFTLERTSQDEEGEESTDVLASARLPEGVDPDAFRRDGADGNSADWKVTFRPDGTSTTGSVSLGTRTLQVDGYGRPTWSASDDPLPDEEEEWPAGELEQRGGA